MFSSVLATIGLVLTVVFSTGCASSMDYSLDRKADGTTKEMAKSSCVGLFCGTATIRGQAPVIVVPMAPAPSYGRDHFYGGRLSYDPAIPAPNVVFGEMLSGTMRAARVDGIWRMCDTRSTAPNYCSRIMDAYGWPKLTSRWR